MEKEQRKIVIPGETIMTDESLLPGDGAYREGKDVVARRYGLAEVNDRQVRVIPISGAYTPRRGNVVIGTVSYITMNGWLIEFGTFQKAFISLTEVPRYINKGELRDFLDFGDSVVFKITNTQGRGIDGTLKQRGLGKIRNGMILNVNANKVPRVIGKEGSMVKIIRNATGCNLTVGQNGVVWIKGEKLEDELNAKKIVLYVVANATSSGLTEAVENYIKELGLEIKVDSSEDLDVVEEDTHEEKDGKE